MGKSAIELSRDTAPRDGKKVFPFADRAYICNILDETWGPIDFDYGRFIIGEREEDEPYKVTEITARFSVADHGEASVTRVPVGALDIAHDLVRIINENAGTRDEQTGALPYLGVFVIEEGSRPTKFELEEAHEKLKSFCEHFVFIADQEYETHRKGQLIPGFARKAAKILNVDKPYTIDSRRQVLCPSCQKGIAPNTVKCPICGAILDVKRAREFHHLPPEPERQTTSK